MNTLTQPGISIIAVCCTNDRVCSCEEGVHVVNAVALIVAASSVIRSDSTIVVDDVANVAAHQGGIQVFKVM